MASVVGFGRDVRAAVAEGRQPETRVAAVKRLLRAVGYEPLHWARVEPYRQAGARLAALDIPRLDALEISAGQHWRALPFRSYEAADFPAFDICKDRLERRFDLIVADNVFEHLPYPSRAAANVLAMLRPGGWFFIMTPFLVRVHEVPIDCRRWTQTGLRYFLEEAGFPPDRIETYSWGNRACVTGNLDSFRRFGFWRPRRNDPRFPVQVWAFAQSTPAA